MIKNTPPKDFIRVILKPVRVILNKEFQKVEESVSVIFNPTLRNPTRR